MPLTSLYTKKVLQNGLTLLLVPIETASSVTISIFVKAGSRYEPVRLNGISHFLEHLHFKGSGKFPSAKRLSETIDSIGGEFNANTGKEHTQYFIRSAYEHMPLIFDVLTDMVQDPLIDEKEMEREKGVIIEEINMYKDNPQIYVDSVFEELLWPDSPLGFDIAGRPEVIRRITREDVLSYRKKYYQPGNMIIAVAGQFDLNLLERLVEERWSGLPSKKTPEYAPIVNGKQKAPRMSLVSRVTEQAHMIVGFRGYSYRHKNNNALRLMSAILGGGMSSRLFIKIREKLGLAYYVNASFNNYLDAGNFTIQAGLKVDSAPEAISAILDELRKIRDEGVRGSELKKAKEYIKGRIALAMEDPHDKLEWYLGQEAFIGKIKTVKQSFEELDQVTSDEIARMSAEILREDRLNMALIGPFKDKTAFESRLKL
ncbi:MAG: M16 family metallopeptidase [Candidatus Saccharibacteria bacterium]